MFVRYIDGDNVSFKELFRNIKSPIVFTSAWTCFKFIFKVIGPLCLVLGMILWTAVSMDSKIGILEFAAFIFIPFIFFMLLVFPLLYYGVVAVPRRHVKQMCKAITAMTGEAPEWRKTGPMKFVFEFYGIEYFAEALVVPMKAECMVIGQLYLPIDDDFPNPFVMKDGIYMMNDDFFYEWSSFLSGKPAAKYIRFSYNSISFIADFKEDVSASDYGYAFDLLKYLPGRFHLMPVSRKQYEEIVNKAIGDFLWKRTEAD